MAWGGNWFFITEDHGMEISLENVPALTDAAWRIRGALEREGITGDDGHVIDHIELSGPADPAIARQQELRAVSWWRVRPLAVRHGDQCARRLPGGGRVC